MRLGTFGRNFWVQAGERALKSAAQAAAGLYVLDQPFDILQASPVRFLGVAAGGFVLSLITSVATAPIGPDDDPSVARPAH